MTNYSIDAKMKEKIAALPNGGVLLLENVRFIE
jgi:3-phosphoglycerate kinase